MVSMTVSEARASLLDLLTRVDGGEEVTITRHGRPVAVVVRPDALRGRRAEQSLADAGHIHDLVHGARDAPWPVGTGVTQARAEELVRAMRTGRRAR